MAVDLHEDASWSRVIGFTSSLPREGKSTVAAAFAAFAAHIGEEAILIDCDLRKASLSRSFFPNARGLVDVLRGDISLEKAILTDPKSRLSFLPAGTTSNLSDTGQLFASDGMKAAFNTLRLTYKYIIVDLPPLAPVVDVRATTSLVDFYVFVVEWGQTNVDVIQQALGDANVIQDKLIGAVLNKVNMKAMSRYQGYRSGYFRNKYFSDYDYGY
jgi:succinoglycan biosynthesis transport protein ExoP